jgi:hypothetical protein
VALCDNEQGIVKVPAWMGNGQDTRNNLYWGLAGGVKTYFNNSIDWELIKTIHNPSENILERVLFKHKTSDTYLLADAYDGRKIGDTLFDFIRAAQGDWEVEISLEDKNLSFGGKSDLVSYIGHNAYMDGIEMKEEIQNVSKNDKNAIILACMSKQYFLTDLKKTGCYPLLTTTGLMAPEAYTLKAALDGWILNETNAEIHERAAQAYHTYQICGINGARRLFSTGW